MDAVAEKPKRARRRAAAAEPASPGAVPLVGEYTMYRAAELHGELKAQLEAGARRFDLSRIAEIDSAGLQLLIAVHASALASGRPAALVAPADCVREACLTLGLAPWLASWTEVT